MVLRWGGGVKRGSKRPTLVLFKCAECGALSVVLVAAAVRCLLPFGIVVGLFVGGGGGGGCAACYMRLLVMMVLNYLCF
ncbi:hypothetical protein HDK90DRAFT_483856 [Phyllosticta capitalensis]|uniref:Transmembrane protein n=1 Tax=Phyllosticta capitalensis TaxID=121624 RepID=A0ABR1YP61_9PEZI